MAAAVKFSAFAALGALCWPPPSTAAASPARGSAAACAAACRASPPAASVDGCMLQVSHRAEVATAQDAILLDDASSWHCCGGCVRGQYCSPYSGNCYNWRGKHYYQRCNGGTGCCGGCQGRSFCSPASGSCYDSKLRGYYIGCSSDDAACCGGCAGRNFCSPISGSCYDWQGKPYYVRCEDTTSTGSSTTKAGSNGTSLSSTSSRAAAAGDDGGATTTGVAVEVDESTSSAGGNDSPSSGGSSGADAPAASSTTAGGATEGAGCCAGCARFCSPISSNCYDSQSKDYYLDCNSIASTSSTGSSTVGSDSGSNHDLGSGSSCCHGCSGRNFCSPVSSNCYDWRGKDYYVSCISRDVGVTVSANDTDDLGEDRFTCCGGCAGRQFCSPLSQSCYDSKSKPYYMVCNEGRGFDLQACEGPGNLRVKVLTYNLFWWNLFRKRGGNGGSAGRLISGAAQGEAFDVIGFQECDNPGWVMGDAGMMSGDYEKVRWGSNTIAYRRTRWERVAHGHDYTAEDRSDQYYGRRGVQWVRLREAATGATLFFAHTHGPLPVNTGGRYGGEASAWGILGMLYRFARRGDAVVLTGDFNAEGYSSTVRILENRIYRVMTNWVDHIFTNCPSGVVETRNLGSGGSDHDALMAVIKF